MKDSIVIDMKYADYDMIDGSYGVERHHLIGGANRSHADEDGLWVPLSPDHHNSSRMSVHHNKEMKVMSHIIAQLAYELEMVSTDKPRIRTRQRKCFGEDTEKHSYSRRYAYYK